MTFLVYNSSKFKILNIRSLEIYDKKFAGNSAGALICLGICLKKTPEEIEDIYTCMATNAIKKYGLNNSSCHDAILKKWFTKKISN